MSDPLDDFIGPLPPPADGGIFDPILWAVIRMLTGRQPDTDGEEDEEAPPHD